MHRTRLVRHLVLGTLGLLGILGGVTATTGPALAAEAPAPDTEVQRTLLELNVRTALLEKLGLPATDITVKATMGEIWLLGTVKNDATAQTAKDIAEDVPGVKTVHEDIKVVDPHQVGESGATRVAEKAEHGIDDGILELRLKSRLIAELGRSAFRLEVESHGGIVNLTGTAPDQARHDLALHLAERTSGVKRVIDLMKIAQ